MDASRAAKVAALLATALVVTAALAQGLAMAFYEGHEDIMTTMFVVERGEDYAAWTRVFAPRDHASAFYRANETPDRILLVRLGDVDALLRGQAVEPIEEFSATGRSLGPFTMDRLHFDVPTPDCPPPTGGCIDATVPAIVWLKGDAWRGAATTDAAYYTLLHEGWTGPVSDERHDGPIHAALAYRRASIVHAAPFWLGVAAFAGAVAVAAALAHAVLELRKPRAPIVPSLPRAESTETMLMLARVTALYVDAIRRSFLVSLAAILAVTVAAMALALPPVLELMSRTLQHMWELAEQHAALFALTPLLAAFVALTLWAVAYVRVQRELKEWRRRARRFEDEAERIVGT